MQHAKKVQTMTVKIPSDELAKLRALAASQSRTVSGQVRQVIREAIGAHKAAAQN